MNLKERFNQEVLSKPGKSPEYLVGMRSNKLKVIDFRYKKSQLLWICECDCGNIAYVRSKSNLLKRLGCQSCTASLSSKNRNDLTAHYGYKNRKYKEYKDGAIKRHFDFDLSKEHFFYLIEQDCYYCGEPPKIKISQYADKTSMQPLKFNGIDRLNSSKGYTKSNSVSCCSDCNYGKHKKSEEDFLKWIEKVYLFNNK